MMDKEQAIKFLKKHQPLPNDNELTSELIQYYNKVREYFNENPSKDCIALFLNSFGDGSGYGVYQLVDEVITKFNCDDVVPILNHALQSKHKGIRSWNAQIAALFPDKRLIKQLSKLLSDRDKDIRYSAITALEQIKDNTILEYLEKRIKEEQDKELLDLISDVISGIKKRKNIIE